MTNEELAIKMQEIDDRTLSNKRRIEKIEERQDNFDKLVSSVTELANEQKHIKNDVADIKGGLKMLVEKPAKRWDSVVDKIIMLIVAAMVAVILAKIGL